MSVAFGGQPEYHSENRYEKRNPGFLVPALVVLVLKWQSTSWRVLCVAAVLLRKNRPCAPCLRNGQTLAPIGRRFKIDEITLEVAESIFVCT